MKKTLKIGIIVAAVVIGGGLASPLFYETVIDEPLPGAMTDIMEAEKMIAGDIMDAEQRMEAEIMEAERLIASDLLEVEEMIVDDIIAAEESIVDSIITAEEAVIEQIMRDEKMMEEYGAGMLEQVSDFVEMEEEAMMDAASAMTDEMKDMTRAIVATTTRDAPADMMAEEMMMMEDGGPDIMRTGMFEGLKGHQAEGLAKIITVDGSAYLRFEDFSVTNGPDLRVYLTNGGAVDDSALHLEKLKGSRGNQNYLLEGVDYMGYDTVVIYCQPFSVHFGQAALS